MKLADGSHWSKYKEGDTFRSPGSSTVWTLKSSKETKPIFTAEYSAGFIVNSATISWRYLTPIKKVKGVEDLQDRDIVYDERFNRYEIYNGMILDISKDHGNWYVGFAGILKGNYTGFESLHKGDIKISKVIRNGEVVYER